MSNNQKRQLKRTIWQHKRFALYGEHRMNDCLPVASKAIDFMKKKGIKNYKYQWIKDYNYKHDKIKKGNVLKCYCEVIWEDNGEY